MRLRRTCSTMIYLFYHSNLILAFRIILRIEVRYHSFKWRSTWIFFRINISDTETITEKEREGVCVCVYVCVKLKVLASSF